MALDSENERIRKMKEALKSALAEGVRTACQQKDKPIEDVVFPVWRTAAGRMLLEGVFNVPPDVIKFFPQLSAGDQKKLFAVSPIDFNNFCAAVAEGKAKFLPKPKRQWFFFDIMASLEAALLRKRRP